MAQAPQRRAMTLHWTKEDDPRWDAARQRLLGPDRARAVDGAFSASPRRRHVPGPSELVPPRGGRPAPSQRFP
jgi:hypothetical protein